MQEEEDNLNEIVEAIFSKPPAPPSSICLQLDDNSSRHVEQNNLMNEFLTMFLLTGVKFLYGDANGRVDMDLLMTSQRQQMLREYIWSIGYDVRMDTFPQVTFTPLH